MEMFAHYNEISALLLLSSFVLVYLLDIGCGQGQGQRKEGQEGQKWKEEWKEEEEEEERQEEWQERQEGQEGEGSHTRQVRRHPNDKECSHIILIPPATGFIDTKAKKRNKIVVLATR